MGPIFLLLALAALTATAHAERMMNDVSVNFCYGKLIPSCYEWNGPPLRLTDAWERHADERRKAKPLRVERAKISGGIGKSCDPSPPTARRSCGDPGKQLPQTEPLEANL